MWGTKPQIGWNLFIEAKAKSGLFSPNFIFFTEIRFLAFGIIQTMSVTILVLYVYQMFKILICTWFSRNSDIQICLIFQLLCDNCFARLSCNGISNQYLFFILNIEIPVYIWLYIRYMNILQKCKFQCFCDWTGKCLSALQIFAVQWKFLYCLHWSHSPIFSKMVVFCYVINSNNKQNYLIYDYEVKINKIFLFSSISYP